LPFRKKKLEESLRLDVVDIAMRCSFVTVNCWFQYIVSKNDFEHPDANFSLAQPPHSISILSWSPTLAELSSREFFLHFKNNFDRWLFVMCSQ
jgi:hypothetical protein